MLGLLGCHYGRMVLLAGAWGLGGLKNSHTATKKGDRARKKGVGG